ncbi:S8 family serine peptidase [Mesobacillus zeae]|uniref:Peptidase S8 n=1 Tax=Mesobacillus zeae TaxID=1917180 RepID=A0A398B1Q3_9BACI|nr:S8 family serine peptidase [Mesobacillus zeae]RID81736.1 hypothetical protein D1970_21020 [Mesobacillus zeae]
MKRPLLFLIASAFFLVPTAASAADLDVTPKVSKFSTEELFDKKENDFASRELIIKFRETVREKEKQAVFNSIEGVEIESLPSAEFSLVKVPKGTNLEKLAENLLSFRQVEFVEPNYRVESAYVPRDPGYTKQWYLKKINAPQAWDQNKGSEKITVAVIDGGVQTNHPDLIGKIVSPYDMVSRKTRMAPDVHGTHVAGIIAASNNKIGISGVAPNVKIMPINVFSGNDAEMYNIADAIIYAADRKADVINMSLGSRSYSYIVDYAVNYAAKKGVMVVAAAGNEDTDAKTYPAALKHVVGISATDIRDRITYFSNFGSYIDFAAPGNGIYSTVSGSSYTYLSGTSMASPVVAGAAALVLSKNPLLTPSQVMGILKKSSVDLGDKGWDGLYGFGRIDVNKALMKTPAPISSISQTAPSFSVDAERKNGISFTLQGGTKFSLYIQNSKGETVKKIITNKKWTGGKVSASWNGKLDSGKYAWTGNYKLVVKASNGKRSALKRTDIKVTNNVVPSIKAASSALYSPAVTGKLTIPYTVNKKAMVTAVITNSSNREVRRLLNRYTVLSRTRQLTWDGKDSKGKRVADGKYTLSLSVVDSAKRRGTTRKMVITVDTKGPTAKTVVKTSPFVIDGKSKTAFSGEFKEKVTVNAYVITGENTKLKTLASKKVFNPGTINFSWDGKNDKAQAVPEGKYRYMIELSDAAGNKTIAKSSVFELVHPPVVRSQAEFNYPSEGETVFGYSVSKPGTVTVQIFKDGQPFRKIEENIAKTAGSHQFVWDGKNDSGNPGVDGDYAFKISIKDNYSLSHTFSGTIHLKWPATVTPDPEPSVEPDGTASADEAI